MKEQGFTLVEILVALGLVTITVVFAAVAISQSHKALVHARQIQAATLYGQGLVEETEASPPSPSGLPTTDIDQSLVIGAKECKLTRTVSLVETRGFIRAEDKHEALKLLEGRGMRVRMLIEEEASPAPAPVKAPPMRIALKPDAPAEAPPLRMAIKHDPHAEAPPLRMAIKHDPHAEAPPLRIETKPGTPGKAPPAPEAGPVQQKTLPRSSPGEVIGPVTLRPAAHQAHRKERAAVTEARPPSKEGGAFSLSRLFPIPSQEFLTFFTQMAFLYKTGIPLARGLTLMAQQIGHDYFREIIEAVQRKVEQGSSFTAALCGYQEIFSKTCITLLHSGEASGQLENMLFKAAALKEKEIKLARQLSQAATYPLVVFAAIVIFVAIMGKVLMVNVLPILTTGKVKLPWFTGLLIGGYKIASSPLFLLALAVRPSLPGRRYRCSGPH
ncbi:MAG: type II secretion system F family protein [Candidatus Eremiobacteraeota bacterium]|nr:type II secretion system F family protein [Candidatus Eremiobacteraeota bacterium]